MPALITHDFFGRDVYDRLYTFIGGSRDEADAFLLGNQGPDPFFFHILTPRVSDCTLLAQVMHRSRMSRQFACLRDGVSHLLPRDASLGRAFALGLLSHYVLDRNAHPFVYEQQFGIVESDSELEDSSSQVHAVIESDLDVLMLQLKRDGATVDDYPPAGEIVTTDRINRVAGVLMSYVAGRVYGIDIPAGEYGAAVANMQRLYRAIEPAGSAKTRAISLVEGLVHDYSLLDGLAHRVTTELPERTGNLGHLTWKNPFTDEVSNESFPEVFDRALVDYECTVARFIETGDMDAVTSRVNYSGRVLNADEEFDREE